MFTTDGSSALFDEGVNGVRRLDNLVRMSHRHDPHTSQEAAAKISQTQKERVYSAVRYILGTADLTPAEVFETYSSLRNHRFWPEIDLQEIRRRMTEMQHDLGQIEPIVVGTLKGGKPQYMTREGQRVMRLTAEEVAA